MNRRKFIKAGALFVPVAFGILAPKAMADGYLFNRRKAWRKGAAAGGAGDIAYRSSSHVVGTGTNATPSAPSGAAENDIFIGVAHCAAAGTLGLPAGWTSLFAGTDPFDTNYDYNFAWIRRGASAPDMTFTMGSSVFREVFVHAFVGCIATGSPVEASIKAQGSSSSFDPGQVTTVNNNALIFIGGMHWSGSSGGYVAPANYTIRGDNTSGNNSAAASRTSLLAASTAEDPATFTNTGGIGNWQVVTLALSD